MNLNRAFIKAYERHLPRPSPSPAGEPVDRRAAPIPANSPAWSKPIGSTVEPLTQPVAPTFFSAYGVRPSDSWRESAAQSASARSGEAVAGFRETDVARGPVVPYEQRIDPPHRATDNDARWTDIPPWQPASVHADSIPAVATASPLVGTTHAGLLNESYAPILGEPALQVERFAWPAICLNLLERAEQPFHALAEQIFSGAAEGRKLLVVSGYRRGEGRTTFLLALGRAMAARGARVVLVDADLDHRGLAEQLGISPEVGWQDVLAGHLPLEEALIESQSDGVTLLPVTSRYARASSFDPASMRQNLEMLREAYDFVFVDGGPWGDASSTGPAIPLWEAMTADGAIMVHDVSTSSLVNPSITQRRLGQRRIPWWGIVENFTQSRQ